MMTEFEVLGVKIFSPKGQDEIIEEITEGPEVKVGLLVKDMKNKADFRTYLLNVSSPKSLFGISKEDLEDTNFNMESIIKKKVKLITSHHHNDFMRGLVKREEDRYSLINTFIVA